MPSSYHRPSPGTGRQTRAGSPGLAHGSQRQPRPQPKVSASAQDVIEDLREKVKNANTKLNKVTSELDRSTSWYEKLNQDLSNSHKKQADLEIQVEQLKEEARNFDKQVRGLKKENAASKSRLQELESEKKQLASRLEYWKQVYTIDEHKYAGSMAARAAPARPAGAPAKPPPEQPKPSRKPKEERARKGDKEARVHWAEKERLSRRFDDKAAPKQSRPQSFVDPWGAAAPPVPSPPLKYADDPPLHRHVAFSNVPHTIYPRGSGLYPPDGGGGSYDDRRDDGNYHQYPVVR